MSDTNRFGIADYVVFAGMLASSAVIGVYYAFCGSKQNDTQEFLMGGRSMGVFPVALSVLASFLSAITLLGLPAEIYTFGTQYWIQVITYPLTMFLTAYFFIPVFYELELTSSFEYLEKRFGRSVRTLGSALFCFQMIFYMAIVLYAPSLALAHVTGLNIWISVLSIGIVCTFYTAIGGMKAVIWTDVFQTLIMFCSMLAVVIKGFIDAGGISNVIQINQERDRIELFNMDPNPLIRHTFWTVTVGSIINWVSVYSTNQAMVQRYLSIPTLAKAKSVVWVVLPFFILMVTLCCSAGLVIFAKYKDCDPISAKRVSATDQLFPLFVMETLGFLPGFPGLFVAGIFSGALSTVSSGVNSLAAVSLEDFVKTYMFPNLSEKKATYLTKSLAVAYGVISIILVAAAQQMGNVLQAALAVFALIGVPIFTMFLMGMLIPPINCQGCFWGTLCGIGVSLWIGIGSMIAKPYIPKKPMSFEGCTDYFGNAFYVTTPDPLDVAAAGHIKNEHVLPIYRLSYLYYGVVGLCVTVITAFAISFITGMFLDTPIIDARLLSPLIRKRYDKRSITFVDTPNANKSPSVDFTKRPSQTSNTEGIANNAFETNTSQESLQIEDISSVTNRQGRF